MSAHVPRIPGYIVKIPDDSRTNRDANRCVDYYVFEWESKRLNIWPERLHRRQPNQEEIAEAKARSNNQLRKLMEKYAKTELVVGAYVDFDLFDDRLSIANNVEKRGNEPRDKIQYRNFEMMLKTVCVVKPGEPRLCHSLDYTDPVEADAGLLQQLLPDVPLNAFLTFRLDFKRLEAHPLLHEVAVSDMVATNKLERLPDALSWHRVVYQLADVHLGNEFDDLDVVQPDEVTRYEAAIAKEDKPKERIKSFGFFTKL